MASRTPSRRRASGRSSSSSNANQMPMILGAVGVVVIILLVVMNSGGGEDDADTSKQQPKTQAPASKPHVPKTNLSMSSAQAGKTPEKPAPTLTMEMLGNARDILQEAKVLSNEGVKLRNAGESMKARAKQSEAKKKIDAIKAMLEPALRWQEEADMDDWAQPAEYVTLGRFYGKVSTLEKRVRMGGGKR